MHPGILSGSAKSFSPGPIGLKARFSSLQTTSARAQSLIWAKLKEGRRHQAKRREKANDFIVSAAKIKIFKGFWAVFQLIIRGMGYYFTLITEVKFSISLFLC